MTSTCDWAPCTCKIVQVELQRAPRQLLGNHEGLWGCHKYLPWAKGFKVTESVTFIMAVPLLLFARMQCVHVACKRLMLVISIYGIVGRGGA